MVFDAECPPDATEITLVPLATPRTVPESLTVAMSFALERHPDVTDWVWPLLNVAVALAVNVRSIRTMSPRVMPTEVVVGAGGSPGAVGVLLPPPQATSIINGHRTTNSRILTVPPKLNSWTDRL